MNPCGPRTCDRRHHDGSKPGACGSRAFAGIRTRARELLGTHPPARRRDASGVDTTRRDVPRSRIREVPRTFPQLAPETPGLRGRRQSRHSEAARGCRRSRRIQPGQGVLIMKVVVNPREVRRFASFLEERARELKQLDSTISRELLDLQSTWKDARYEQFEKRYEEASLQLQRFLDHAERYVAYLREKIIPIERYLERRF